MSLTQNDVKNIINVIKNYNLEDHDMFNGPEFDNIKLIYGDKYLDIIDQIITEYIYTFYGITMNDIQNIINILKNYTSIDEIDYKCFDDPIFDNFRLIYENNYMDVINYIIKEYFILYHQTGGIIPIVLGVARVGAQVVGKQGLKQLAKRQALKKHKIKRTKAKAKKVKARQAGNLGKAAKYKEKSQRHKKKINRLNEEIEGYATNNNDNDNNNNSCVIF